MHATSIVNRERKTKIRKACQLAGLFLIRKKASFLYSVMFEDKKTPALGWCFYS
ncbi:TPA: hypothetical protein GRI76_14680 [Vibrio parahaemolyticus]|nr:hypothetical protein [Vibrio parahaemolyticus]EGR1754967.1 hypothetical protein [Vibrio parahaemolyticus]HAS6759149.1 hypothetical protein [Vibrio parahaemolyticus]HAS6769200.1 hypothetical protein [Vibrio parahaemolyticus]